MPEPRYARRLREVVATAEPMLAGLSPEGTTRRRAPGKWSPREIVGHLIDSASNNHQRFVRAVWTDDLVFPGYAQEDWVTLQEYHEAPWGELVTLWATFNRHIARVMAAVPEEARARPRARHNLDQIAWRTVPATPAVTLDWFMEDYVGHLEHHLRQLLGDDWERAASGERRTAGASSGAR